MTSQMLVWGLIAVSVVGVLAYLFWGRSSDVRMIEPSKQEKSGTNGAPGRSAESMKANTAKTAQLNKLREKLDEQSAPGAAPFKKGPLTTNTGSPVPKKVVPTVITPDGEGQRAPDSVRPMTPKVNTAPLTPVVSTPTPTVTVSEQSLASAISTVQVQPSVEEVIEATDAPLVTPVPKQEIKEEVDAEHDELLAQIQATQASIAESEVLTGDVLAPTVILAPLSHTHVSPNPIAREREEGSVLVPPPMPELITARENTESVPTSVFSQVNNGQPNLPLAVKSGAQKAHILLVDDSKVVRVKTEKLLTGMGYEVSTAVDGLNALEKLESISPDLIITDIEMPNLDGFGLVRNVRKNLRTAEIPIIVMTSHANLHLDIAATEGINGFLPKPFIDQDLLDQVSFLAQE